jgi:uncharacterized protein
LIVRLSDIEDKLVFKGEMNSLAFKNVEEREFSIESPVLFKLTVTKHDDGFRITGPIHGTLSLSCARCLEEFTCPIDTYLDIKLAPKAFIPLGVEAELRPDDLDIYYLEGDEVDLDPFVYDEVLLNIPAHPLCREGCEGLCQSCGRNMNTDPCSCRQPVNSAFGEKLKSFLNTEGEQYGSSET